MPASTRPIFLSWIAFHGRSAGIATALGIESHFLGGGRGNVMQRYLRQWRETRALLTTTNPSSIIVMLPPLPVVLAILSTRSGREAQLVGDLHTGVFENPLWRWALPLTIRLLRGRGFGIVTNDALAERSRGLGYRALAIHDIIEPVDPGLDLTCDDAALRAVATQPFVLVPLAYANDEPVNELLEAARLTPAVVWVLTGRAPLEVRHSAPKNVTFSGFISNDDYARLMRLSTVVCALTTRKFTMQRVGYEALAEGKPLVISNTETLSSYFGDAALYTDTSAASIQSTVLQAFTEAPDRRQRMAALSTLRQEEQVQAISQLQVALNLRAAAVTPVREPTI